LSVTTGNRYYPLIGVLLLGIVAYLTVGEQKDNWWGGREGTPSPPIFPKQYESSLSRKISRSVRPDNTDFPSLYNSHAEHMNSKTIPIF
jgi:hypothetical protein